jgi:hypothetical protein
MYPCNTFNIKTGSELGLEAKLRMRLETGESVKFELDIGRQLGIFQSINSEERDCVSRLAKRFL